MRRILFLGLLILLAKDSTAVLSDFLYLGSSTQTIGTVTSIIDGDTIKVELSGTQTTVRLLSINTPELPDEPYAQEAKDFTSQELLNQPIKLLYSNNPVQQKDVYQRLLAVIIKDDEIFNIKLLKTGLAVRMFIFNDIIKFPAWEDVEISAREQRLKIWSNINSKGIFINEINPNPAPESDDEAEFVELYNNNSTPIDVGSWTFMSIYYKAVIPPGITIPSKGYLILARTNTTRFKKIYLDTPSEAIIINVGDNLVLQNRYNPKEDLVLHLLSSDNSYQDSLTYNLDWDNGKANGTGKTIERKSLSFTNVGDSEVGGVDDANWEVSNNLKGTPGTTNSVSLVGLDVTSWIISCQRPTGAICTDQSKTYIIPYKANITALGLLAEGGYEGYVKAWIEWYFTHLEGGMTISDYKVENDLEVSLGLAEAEDRNITTFFTLLKKYYQSTFDIDYLKSYKEQIEYMAKYLLFVLQDYADYLTWTDSSWQQKFLINNAESYQGLKDLASVYFDLFEDNSQRDFYERGANLIREAIARELWREPEKRYYWQKDSLGQKTDCNWTVLYPDAISQLYPILTNLHLPESATSATLYETFSNYQSAWTRTTSYGEMGYVASLMADSTKAKLYQDTIKDKVINQGYPLPWDGKEAGFYLLMGSRLSEVDKIQSLHKPKELGLNFITSKMLTPFGGIQAQFNNNSPLSETNGVNHEVTSEATSQALLYAVLTGNRTFFDEQFEILKNRLLAQKYNVLVWKLKPNGTWWDNRGQYANASIDDLRSIRALLLSADTFGDENYLHYAKLLAQGLKEHNIQSDEFRQSFSWEPEWTSQEVILSAIDLCTMKRLADLDSDWENILQTNKKIILGGTLSSGLYYYRYTNGNYYGEDENNNINMIHLAWVAENLSRYWKLTADTDCRSSAEKFLNFAKNEYSSYGKIFGRYNLITGTHTVEYEDTSIYSIVARVAFILGDFDFAKDLLNHKILTQQNQYKQSQTVGGFGYDFENPNSFVCLEALLSLVELESQEEYLIRGKVSSSDKKPIEGVLLLLSGTTFATSTTDSNGEYKFSGKNGGSYTITPSKEGYNFTPKTISPLDRHWDNVDFTGLTGEITDVSPICGTVGSLITIKGEGFFSEESIRISFGEIMTLVIITSDTLGYFNTVFTVPFQPSGTITLTAFGSSSTIRGINYFFLRALDHFIIATISSQIAGDVFVISMWAVDARGDIFEYAGTVSLTDTSLSISPLKTTPFVLGRWAGSVSITKVGTTTIKVEVENKVGTSNPFLVKPASINKLVFLTSPPTITAGTSTGVIIFQTQDRFGNPANTQTNVNIQLLTTSLKGRFSLSDSIWEDTNSVTLTAETNTGMFYYRDTLAGTQTITLREEPSQGWLAGTQCILVNPASLDHFDFNTISTQQAGKEFQIEIIAKDTFDNLVDWTGTVSLTVNPHLATFTTGRAIASVTMTKSGTTTIMANFDSISGTSNTFWVTPDEFHHLNIGTITSQIAGEWWRVKIEALDIYGNVATYSDTASLEVGTKTTIIFTQGIWEGTVTITKAGTATITVLAAGKVGTSAPFWVAPNVLNHFKFRDISSQKVGVEFEITIWAMDVYENIASYSGIAFLQDTSQTIWSTKTSFFINGIWQGSVTITKAGTTAIGVFIDNNGGTSNSFWVEPGELDHFTFAVITDQVAGKEFEITIVAKDIYENISFYADKTELQDTSGTLRGGITGNFKNGIWQGTVAITKAGTTCIFANTNTGTSNFFYVSPDILNKIIINPDKIELAVDSQYQFSASGYDKYENEISGLTYLWQTIIGSVTPTLGTVTLFKAATSSTTGTLTATSGTIIGYATITLQSSSLSYIIIIPPNASITVGNSMIFTAKGYDYYNNEKFIEGGTWTIEGGIGHNAPITGTLTEFTAGTKAKQGYLKYQLYPTTAVATISILAGTHTCFKIGTISSSQTAGVPFSITIIPQDSFGNTIENYRGETKLNYSSGKIYPDKITNWTSDAWLGTITVEIASDNAVITVYDMTTPTIKGTSNPFTIHSNTFDYFKINDILPTHFINSEIPLVVTAKDAYGNTVINYNGTFSLTDDTQTIYPKVGTCSSGEFRGSVSISKAKSQIRITVTTGGKNWTSNLFTTLIDNELNSEVKEGNASIEIPRGTLPTDFYIIIDSDPEERQVEINLAHLSLSGDKTSLGIINSLHLFQTYDKNDQPLQIGTNSFVVISLSYPDENQDGIVDYPDGVIKEQTLKIYELKNNHWQEVPNCIVYSDKNSVSALVPRFGVYMLVGQIVPLSFDILVVYPNPFKPIRGDSEIIFDGLPSNATIRIYDISGSLIREIEEITAGSYRWDVKDKYGKDVASGIYLYLISADKERKKGKLAIIR